MDNPVTLRHIYIYKFLSGFASGSLCMFLGLHELILDALPLDSAPVGASCIYKFLSMFASGSHAYLQCMGCRFQGPIAMHSCMWHAYGVHCHGVTHSFLKPIIMHFSNLYRSLVAS